MYGNDKRLAYLDGLRGLACLQVFLLHIATAYFPGLIESHSSRTTAASFVRDSPLFILYDGFLGVFIFFYISGYVLTEAYEKSKTGFLTQIIARLVRLWVPVVVFGVVTLICYWLFPVEHVILAGIVHSDWFLTGWNVDDTFSGILKDLLFTPLFTGYQNTPLARSFSGVSELLPAASTAFNAPTWTMSAELQGSILILVLVLVRKYNWRLWAARAGLV